MTQEKVEMYPCRYQGVSVSGTNPGTFYFYIYPGNINMPLLGFDYLDDCSFHHGIGGSLIVNAIAENAGKRFYPEKLLDFNIIMEKFKKEREMVRKELLTMELNKGLETAEKEGWISEEEMNKKNF